MVICFECNGTGETIREEWDRQWDRYDQNSPSHYHTNLWMDRSGIDKFGICPVCKGDKELNEIKSNYQLNGKNATVQQFYGDSIDDYVLLHFEDGVFAKVPTKNIKYFKKS